MRHGENNMKITKLINSNKKIIKKLWHIWSTLTEPDNFLIPETVEDYKSFFYTSKIKVNNSECYFSKAGEEKLEEFISVMQSIIGIKGLVSHAYIKSTVIDLLGIAVAERLAKKSKPNMSQIEDILGKLLDSCKRYQFIRPIEGLELIDIPSIRMGDSEIFIFDLGYKEKIKQHCEQASSLDFYQKSVVTMIDKYFINKVCVITEVFGECGEAKKIALKRMQLVINLFRFFLSFFIHKRVWQHVIQINLASDMYKHGDESICIDSDNHELTLSYGRGRMPLQRFSINAKLINELKNKLFFDESIALIGKDNLSELEGSILTAIHWIGEAQNEFNYDIAFLKYWTALEAITYNPNDISEALSNSIAVLSAFGEYGFIRVDEVKDVKKAIKKLYKKRSIVVHRGGMNIVSALELAEICKYSTWAILNLFSLRRKNYTKLQDIKKEIDRLFSTISNPRKRMLEYLKAILLWWRRKRC